MGKYILKRLGMALITLWAVITITFVIMHTVPGDPFSKEGRMPESVRRNLEKHYNLDKPLYVQYGTYMLELFKLNLGPSMKHKTRTVNDYIRDNFPRSLHLGLQALIVASILGILLGIVAAVKRNKWPDYICMVIAIIGISVPSFILATLLIQTFAVKWQLLPTSGWKSPKYTILPTFSLCLLTLAYSARMMRSSMLEVLGQDYIRTAKAKGLSRWKVLYRHAFRNAIMPVVTALGVSAANLVVGSFIIEKIFGIPGLGKYLVVSIQNRDYSVILGITIFYSIILIGMNFVVDMLYIVIDPRISIDSGKRSVGKFSKSIAKLPKSNKESAFSSNGGGKA